ncbi:di-cis-decaprenylcistransferase [Colletotrichum karsti]|uniref:ditrans,polycis-polyprenyl diphosphate synthase [(2E,6E)-farnesyldiphosphate specific] n=1 Tax=Colletotrichum karsti TaxID=1095194 RepID=A0A9P6LP12_9PEZI|nr:di-cis-decaprenylcistransferase [Colletotrichum karsti]KAF9879122.1 di-cis-decaprenylcistransferase [Colletotrichum karsti]
MALNARDRRIYRTDDKEHDGVISERNRRKIIENYLPKPEEDTTQQWREDDVPPPGRFGLRRALRSKLHLFLYTVLHAFFSLYIRIRQAWHLVCYHISSVMFYHHRTPEYIERDVVGLKKKPKHLSVILKMEEGGRHGAELERLVGEAAEIAVWCVCARIPVLTVYERTGLLKRYLPHVQQSIIQKSRAYFGRHQPALTVAMPHADEILKSPAHGDFASIDPRHLKVLFISAEDGRESMVDLTRTLAEMSQKGKIHPRDISIDLIDAELSEGIMPEPDLLIHFGPYVDLDGYPPWPVRLTEIFCLPDNQGVAYTVFLRALRNFANAQFRKGK